MIWSIMKKRNEHLSCFLVRFRSIQNVLRLIARMIEIIPKTHFNHQNPKEILENK